MALDPGGSGAAGAAGGRLDGPALALGLLALALMGGVFALDVLTPPDVAAGALYSIVIFYSWLMRSGGMVLGIGAACSVLAFAEDCPAVIPYNRTPLQDHIGEPVVMVMPMTFAVLMVPGMFTHRASQGVSAPYSSFAW